VRSGRDVGAAAADLDLLSKTLDERLLKQVTDLTPQEFVDGRRFVSRLHGAAAALRSPDIKATLAAAEAMPERVKTVAGLVDYLVRERLRLTPPLAGDEGAYRELGSATSIYSGSPRKPAEK
jgi:hypothetical protein